LLLHAIKKKVDFLQTYIREKFRIAHVDTNNKLRMSEIKAWISRVADNFKKT